MREIARNGRERQVQIVNHRSRIAGYMSRILTFSLRLSRDDYTGLQVLGACEAHLVR